MLQRLFMFVSRTIILERVAEFERLRLAHKPANITNSSDSECSPKRSFMSNLYAVDGQRDLGVLPMLCLWTSGMHPDHCGGRLHVLPAVRCMGKK